MGKVFTPLQQNWHWYQDDAAEPSTQLSDEITKAYLPNNDDIFRLRLSIAETGDISGSGVVTIEYSTNESDWYAMGSGNDWNYANGQATESGTTTTFKCSDAGVHGLYHESGSISESWSKSEVLEMDFALQPTSNITDDQDYYFRAKIDETEVALNSGETHPVVHSALGANEIDVGDDLYISDVPTIFTIPVRVIDTYDNIVLDDVPTIYRQPIPEVTSCNDFSDKETGVVIGGLDFGSSQGTGKVEIGDSSVYATANKVEQTVTNWTDTAITITGVLSTQSPGTKWIFITHDNGKVGVGYSVHVYRAEAFQISASDYIDPSGENTTYQLTPPGSKSGSTDFTAGRIQDDENPADSVNLAAEHYTEMEWCFKALDDSREVQYDFRITVNGEIIDTYTLTPHLTITAGGVLQINVNDNLYCVDDITPVMGDLGISVAECIDIDEKIM